MTEETSRRASWRDAGIPILSLGVALVATSTTLVSLSGQLLSEGGAVDEGCRGADSSQEPPAGDDQSRDGAASKAESNADDDQPPQVLRDLGVNEERVRKRFETEAGLTGWVLEPEKEGQDPGMVYTTPDGRYALTGAMIAPDQNVLSQEHLAEHAGLESGGSDASACGGDSRGDTQGNAEASDAAASGSDNTGPRPEEALKALEEATALSQGEGEAQAYVIMDPHCPYSHRFYEAVQELTSKVTFHWVPVGYLGQRSLEDAAAILGAEDRLAAFEAAMTGGSVDADASDSDRERIQEHNELANSAGLDGTPALVLVDADGEAQAVRQGALPAEALEQELGL